MAEELRWAAVGDTGSQFRSRDLFPQAAAAIALGQAGALGEVIPRTDIPDVPNAHIAYVDGYGNIKTTIKHEQHILHQDRSVRVRIGEVEREALVSDGSFAVEPDQLAFAPGSSGWSLADGGTTRWMELFLRGGNAWEAFQQPAVGVPIHIEA